MAEKGTPPARSSERALSRPAGNWRRFRAGASDNILECRAVGAVVNIISTHIRAPVAIS